MVKTAVRISGRGGAATRPAQVHILLAWLLPAVLPNGNAPDGTGRHEGAETPPSSWTTQHEIAPDVRGVTNAVRLIIRCSGGESQLSGTGVLMVIVGPRTRASLGSTSRRTARVKSSPTISY